MWWRVVCSVWIWTWSTTLQVPSSPMPWRCLKSPSLFSFSKVLHWYSIPPFFSTLTGTFCNYNCNFFPLFPQGLSPSFCLSWSCWVSPSSPNPPLLSLKWLWRRSEQNAMEAQARFGQNTRGLTVLLYTAPNLLYLLYVYHGGKMSINS